ncbi:hypothetical protein TWF694_010237 [Orbilia ellipsospora]|uniref:Uncharacterized protein n=1 Tax=Orbilia ellipsospora TaxID=2528407 RepID=A0AAV9X993_9PEZI
MSDSFNWNRPDLNWSHFHSLANLLSLRNADKNDVSLWNEQVLYQKKRIREDYIPNLKVSFEAYETGQTVGGANALDGTTPSNPGFSDLRTLLFDRDGDHENPLENYTRLMIACYDLRQMEDLERTLNSSSRATSKSKNLWVNICMFSRLRVAFENFKDISTTLPSFKNVRIVLVARPSAPAHPPQNPLNLAQTFNILKLDVNPQTTKAVLGGNWDLAKIQEEFTQRQKEKLNVHAEIQVLICLGTIGESSTVGDAMGACLNRGPYQMQRGSFLAKVNR